MPKQVEVDVAEVQFVEGCSDCPFAYWSDQGKTHLCERGAGDVGADLGGRTAPDRCPLHQGGVLVKLSTGVQA